MKTVSFIDFKAGYNSKSPLLILDSKTIFSEGIHLLIAPNGYGKSTLIQTLAGLIPALQGEARLNESRLRPERDVFFLSEYLSLPKFITGAEWTERIIKRKQEVPAWVERFRLKDKW